MSVHIANETSKVNTEWFVGMSNVLEHKPMYALYESINANTQRADMLASSSGVQFHGTHRRWRHNAKRECQSVY